MTYAAIWILIVTCVGLMASFAPLLSDINKEINNEHDH